MRSIGRVARLGLAVALLLLSAYNYGRYREDNRVFADTAARVCPEGLTERERLEALVLWAEADIAPRRLVPYVEPPLAVRFMEKVFSPFPRRALEGRTSCGAASSLFAAVCREADLRARSVCLHRNEDVTGEPPAHVTVECWVDGRWAVVDPLFGVLFRLPNGQLATAEDVRRHPEFVALQVADDYRLDLWNYRHVTRMNWNAVPVVLPLAYRLLHAVMGQSVDEVRMPAIRGRPRLQMTWLSLLLGVALLAVPPLLARRRARRRTRERVRVAPMEPVVAEGSGDAVGGSS